MFYAGQPGGCVSHNANRQCKLWYKCIAPADQRARHNGTIFCLGNVLLHEWHTLFYGTLFRKFRICGQPEIVIRVKKGKVQQLAQQYYGQAQDAAGYAAAMRATFNMDDDGSLSKFGDQDLRADMDSVIVGSKVTQDTDLADALRSYYENLTEYDRAKEFISLSFGTQDTSNSSFADAVYRALLDDSGMQLLFYMNGMWSVNGWQIKEDYAPAVRGAADLFAEYLAGAVNHEKVKSETNDRLVAMGGQALSDALAALGDSDAAAAALAAANELADSTQSAVSSGSDAISAARDTLQTKFNVKIFQLILLIAAAAAAFMLVFSMVMFVVHRKEN